MSEIESAPTSELIIALIGDARCSSPRSAIAAEIDRRIPATGGESCQRVSFATCRFCGDRLFYSARQRGDGLCSPCHRKATGTQTPFELEQAQGVAIASASRPDSATNRTPDSAALSASLRAVLIGQGIVERAKLDDSELDRLVSALLRRLEHPEEFVASEDKDA